MPPTTAGIKPRTPAVVPSTPGAEELVQQLEQKEVALKSTTEKLDRLASAQVALNGERRILSSQLREERTQYGDISDYLKHALEEQQKRADGLEARLADALTQLKAAQAAAAEATQAAERRIEVAEAEWEQQAERLHQADEFLAERDGLVARVEQLEQQVAEQARAFQERHLDMDSQHASDREAWRRDTQAAVQAAREEVVAQTDELLDASTKKTILDNEALAAELRFQTQYVQGLLNSISTLQHETEELRLALDITRKSEQEFARKALACEKAAESLVARLATLEAERAQREQAVAEARQQVQQEQEETQAVARKLEERQRRVEELEANLADKRRELKQVKASQSDAANFLLTCMADVRQEVLAARGRSVLAAAAASIKSELPLQPLQQPQLQSRLQLQSIDGTASGAVLAASTSAEPSAVHGQPLLAELSLQQRQAALQKLLQLLQPDWQDTEGLVLPQSSSASTCSVSLLAEASVAALAAARSMRSLAAVPTARSMVQASRESNEEQPAQHALQAMSPMCSSSSSSGCLGGDASKAGCRKQVPSKELMQLLHSEVRPWGSRGSSPRGSPKVLCEQGC